MDLFQENSKVKPGWCRIYALRAYSEIHKRLAPVCEKIIYAGSLRRGARFVGDVEILYIPHTTRRAVDFFFSEPVNLVDEELEKMIVEGMISKRKAKAGSYAWGEKNKFAVHRSGIPIDFFSTSIDCWYNYLVCRTGPQKLNVEIATRAKKLGWKWNAYGPGFSKEDGSQSQVEMGSETEVFEFVGLPYREPGER